MILFISQILLLLNFLSVNAEENKYENDHNAITLQIKSYLNEFDINGNTTSLWFLYNVLNSVDDVDIYFNKIIDDSLFHSPFLNDISICIHDNVNNNNDLDFIGSFVYCSNNTELYLSYLHDINTNDPSYYFIYSKLNISHLSNKEKYIFQLLDNPILDNNYTLDINNLSILDFYFIDKSRKLDDSHDFELFLNSLKNNIDNISHINTINSKFIFILSVITYYKFEKEHEVYNISRILANYDDLPISNLFLRILNYISYSSYINGYYQYDIDLYRNFILPITNFLSIERNIKAQIDYGVSLYRIGNTTSSLTVFENIYEKRNYITDYRYYSALLNNLGIAYLNVGYFENYIQLQLEALSFSEANSDLNQQLYFLNNLYIYHRRIQNWNTAIEYLEQVKRLAEEADDVQRLARVAIAFGTFHRDYKNDLENSINHLYDAINLSNQSDNYHILLTSLIELAATYEQTDDFYSSYKYYNRAAKIARDKNDEMFIIYLYAQIANIYMDNDDIEGARYFLDTIYSYDRTKMIFSSQVNLETIISKSLFLDDKIDKAFNALRIFAEEIIHRTVHSSDIQSGHIFLDTNYLTLFKLLIERLVRHDYLLEAMYWMDEIKNLSSVNFYNNPALKSSILSENELVLDFALRNRIERIRSQLRTADEDQRIQLNNLLIEAISEQNSLRRKVLQNIDLKPVNLNRIRRQLGRSDIILYFSIFEDQLYISTITAGTFNVHQVSFSIDDINRIDDLVKNLSSDKVRLTELVWFKEKIFKNIEIPNRYTNYYIIPDGFLYHIPFEILPVGDVSSDFSYGEATYLIEKASIAYSNSLKDLESSFSHNPRRKYDHDFVGFGITNFNNQESQLSPGRYLPALPLAETEVREISNKLTSFENNIYHLSDSGTETNFRKRAGNSRILHFASHSEVFENDPLYSLIYLNPDGSMDNDPTTDGLVYAYELFQMDLANEMVMLNSCESGSGSYIQGSGIVGFSRAFNYAGVQSLVMNLWSVRDRSAYHLSVSFYEYLNQGFGKSEALRKAKIDYINTHNSNPSYWGSFVLYGNIDPLTPSHNHWFMALAFIFIGAISIIVAWFRLPKKLKAISL